VSGVRVLVHGTGSIGSRHLRVLRERLAVDALYALPVREGRASSAEIGDAEVVSTERATALRPDAYIVATDTARHVRDVVQALASGAKVLVEKPLARTRAEAEPLTALVGEATLYVAAPLRFQSALARFREALPRIGRPHAVRIECVSYLPEWRPGRPYKDSYSARRDEGGVLLDLIHEIDYALWCFGPPRRVWARLGNGRRLGIESEEEAELAWETDAGTWISLRLDYLTRTRRRRMVADGENGTLCWDGIEQSVTFVQSSGEIERWDDREDVDAMMESQTRAFLSTVTSTETRRLSTLDDALRALAVCDAARESARTGAWCTLSGANT
jgi:predicted dehydrogenase